MIKSSSNIVNMENVAQVLKTIKPKSVTAGFSAKSRDPTSVGSVNQVASRSQFSQSIYSKHSIKSNTGKISQIS